MAAEDRMREDGMGWAARQLAVTFKLAVVRGWSLRVIELQVAKSASPKYGKAHHIVLGGVVFKSGVQYEPIGYSKCHKINLYIKRK